MVSTEKKEMTTGYVRGEVTVYLTLTFILLVSLVLALTESASIQMAKNYRRADMNRAVECVFAEYQKELLEHYDVFYVTENGLVYHKDYHCSYLDLSIRMTHMGTVSDLRNESGGRYYPCEHCMKGNAGTIYITNFGDRYHSSLSCSGLKRTIYAIPVSEAAGKGACSKCGR